VLFGKKSKKTTVAELQAERASAQAAAEAAANAAAPLAAEAPEAALPLAEHENRSAAVVELAHALASPENQPVHEEAVEEMQGHSDHREMALAEGNGQEDHLDTAMGRKRGIAKTLQARDLVKTYRGRNVVDHVNIHVRTGEIVGLLGPNGAGKTTTFYMVIGLVTPNAGQVLLDGEEITRLPIYKRARRGIGYLAQESSVFKKLSVEENILLVWEARGVSEARQREMLMPLLREFKIDHIRRSKCYVLSGGERRRTEVARALAGNPDFIMLDEPFTGIDPVTIESLKEIIAGLRDRGLGVLITDHNVRETLSICDRAYIIMDGRVLVEGTPQEVAANEMARKYFLGEQFKLD
jgi:lipopolysaccharide export system ATP-binding protein